ncbi:hypothetical protein HOE425_320410 [Hoeflea sp. EC-HK425]|nr:hypothetical protein HOE425_320410 [Hoeflea sp. EC-HK425]
MSDPIILSIFNHQLNIYLCHIIYVMFKIL